MGIVNASGTIVARYTYDPWGKVIDIRNALGNIVTSSTHVGNINPIRYRGYYYDSETGLYYLNSRYYDPTVGRFVNADGYVQTGTGIMDKNMYAYCLDDPVNMVDLFGEDPVPQWARNIINGVATDLDYTLALSVDPGSWAGTAGGIVRRAVALAEEYASNHFLVGYSEHKRKGTTNPANRKKHEEGQARKQRDAGKEKGDARRTNRSNKRKPQQITAPEYGVGDKILSGVIIAGGTVAIVYFVVNDITGVGVFDDAAIAGILPVIWDNASKIAS